MAVKSVIDVQVNDEAFSTFKALFDKYKEHADSLPGVWAEVGRETKVASLSFGDMVAAMMAQAALAETLEKRQREASVATDKAGRTWRDIAKSSKTVAGNVLDATKSLLKWASLTGLVTGLLGGGGLLGIDELALGVASSRRSSLGLGLGYGEQKAFETDFGRFVDPNSFLSGVSTSLHDVSKKWALRTAGVSEATIEGGDTGAVGAELLASVKALVDKTPANELANVATSRGLDQFFTLQDLVRLKGSSADEIADQEREYRNDSKSFGLTPDATRKWQDFSTQLSRAGTKIQTVLVEGLTPLTPALSRLSDSFAKALGTFLGVADPARMKKIADGIDSFAKYIGSDKFQTDVHDFATNIALLAEKVADIVDKLGGHAVRSTAEAATFGAVAGGAIGGLLAGPGGIVIGAEIGGAALGAANIVGLEKSEARRGGAGEQDYVSRVEKTYGLPSGFLTGIWGAESNFSRDPRAQKENAEGALGPFQFTQGTANDYGVTDRRSLSQTADAAARYFNHLDVRYKGDTSEALAAYNWGPRNVDKDIAKSEKSGQPWQAGIPSETADYITKVKTIAGTPGGGFDDLKARYHGDVSKALAAFNFGAKNVDKDIARDGAGWQKDLPAATAAYVAKVLSIARKSAPGAKITINNNTGGSAVIAASQLQ